MLAQKIIAYLLKKEIENRLCLLELGDVHIVKKQSARAHLHMRFFSHDETSVLVICRCETKRRGEMGEAAFESSHQYLPNPCLTF